MVCETYVNILDVLSEYEVDETLCVLLVLRRLAEVQKYRYGHQNNRPDELSLVDDIAGGETFNVRYCTWQITDCNS